MIHVIASSHAGRKLTGLNDQGGLNCIPFCVSLVDVVRPPSALSLDQYCNHSQYDPCITYNKCLLRLLSGWLARLWRPRTEDARPNAYNIRTSPERELKIVRH